MWYGNEFLCWDRHYLPANAVTGATDGVHDKSSEPSDMRLSHNNPYSLSLLPFDSAFASQDWRAALGTSFSAGSPVQAALHFDLYSFSVISDFWNLEIKSISLTRRFAYKIGHTFFCMCHKEDKILRIYLVLVLSRALACKPASGIRMC